MKYKQHKIYLPYFWALLDELALEEHYSHAEVVMNREAKSTEVELAKVIGTVLLPGQVFIWEPVQLDSRRPPKQISLWEMRGSAAVINSNFITTWLKWRVRQVSSTNLVPEDLRQIFTDPNKVLVTDVDFEDSNDGIDELNSFKDSQQKLFKEHLGWSPTC